MSRSASKRGLVRVGLLTVLALVVVAGPACGARQKGKAAKPKVIIDGTSLVIITDSEESLPIEIPFQVDSAELEGDSHDALDVLAEFLNDHADLSLVEVRGHSDNRGTPEYNLDLSKRRAESVVTYLVRSGVDSGRLRSKGFGAQQPAVDGSHEAAWEQNRRVEFVIIDQSDVAP